MDRLVLQPTPRERWSRLFAKYGILSGLFLGSAIAGSHIGFLLMAILLSAIGVHEFVTPDELEIGPGGIRLTRNGRTLTFVWEEVRYALPWPSIGGDRARLLLGRPGSARWGRPWMTLHYRYGYKEDGLVHLINEIKSESDPVARRQIEREMAALRFWDKYMIILLPALLAGVVLIMWLFGW
jgi:hypothetical protein